VTARGFSTPPIADCSGHKKGPGVESQGQVTQGRNVLPLTQKPGPARQKSFSLFTAYLREYRAKILESAVGRNVHWRTLRRAHQCAWPAEWLCGALGVSRGGFYAWLTRPRSRRSRSNEELGALVMAIWRRGKPDALLHHSDRGSQYTSEQFQKLMADHGIICSMSRSGNVWDNAAMESFFSSLKTERTARKTYRTRDQAKADVFDYIECFYNAKRRHSTIGHKSPMEFEMQAELA
jgi:transposase InsO family protein